MRLQEMLQAPELTATRILASGDALNRSVNWVTVYELLDELSLVEAGDLILTDGFDLDQYQQDFPMLCQRILRQQASGLGLVPGKYLTAVPAGLIEAAWESGLTLFFFPPGREVADYGKVIIQLLTRPRSGSQGQTGQELASWDAREGLANPGQGHAGRKGMKDDSAAVAAVIDGHARRICCLGTTETAIVAQFKEKLAELLSCRCRCTVLRDAAWPEGLLCLAGNLPQPRALRESLAFALEELALSPLPSIGISDIFSFAGDLGQATEQARQAMELGQALSGPGKIAFYENIALYETFLGKKNPGGNLGYSQEMLGRLTAHDHAHHSDLLTTLKVYLQCEGNHRQAAAELGIHRHTLKSRLDKIEDLTACPLSGVGRVNYEIALAYHHFYRIKR